MADSRRPAIVGALAVLLALAIAAPHFLTQKRAVIESTPEPPALFTVTPVQLSPGAQACMDSVTFTPRSQVAHFAVADPAGRPGPALALTAAGPGYRFRTRVPAGYPGSGPVLALLEPPPRSLIGSFCIRNVGRGLVALAGTTEGRTVSRSNTSVDGQPSTAHVSLTLQRRNAEPLAP